MSVRPHLNRKKLSLVAYTCHGSNSKKYKIGGSGARLAWVNSETLSPK
jgi:hypothetical protein